MTEPTEVHFFAGWVPAGSKHQAVCHCGWTTTPRTSQDRARQALAIEHGETQRAACAICGQAYDTADYSVIWLGDVMEPLHDPDRQRDVWVCSDKEGCSERYQAKQPSHQAASVVGLDLFRQPPVPVDELAERRAARARKGQPQ